MSLSQSVMIRKNAESFVRRFMNRKVKLIDVEGEEWVGRLGGRFEQGVEFLTVTFTPIDGEYTSSKGDYIWNDVYALEFNSGWRMSMNDSRIAHIELI